MALWRRNRNSHWYFAWTAIWLAGLSALDLLAAVSPPVTGMSASSGEVYRADIELPSTVAFSTIVEIVQRRLAELPAGQDELQFPEIAGQSLALLAAPQALVLQDVYFDTDDGRLRQAQLSYRLRYEWPNLVAQQVHSWLNFLPWIYPQACFLESHALLSNTDESLGLRWFRSSVKFDNDDEVFLSTRDAPQAPWPLSEMVPVARAGVHAQRMLPPKRQVLAKLGESEATAVSLREQFSVRTRQRRYALGSHLTWILSDKSAHILSVQLQSSEILSAERNVPPAAAGSNRRQLVSIQVWADPTLLAQLSALGGQDPAVFRQHRGVMMYAVKHARQLRDAMVADQLVLRDMLRDAIESLPGAEIRTSSLDYILLGDLLGTRGS